MKKIYFKILVIILIIIGSFSVSFANEDEDADYNETKKSIDSYIDNQLEKIDLKPENGQVFLLSLKTMGRIIRKMYLIYHWRR